VALQHRHPKGVSGNPSGLTVTARQARDVLDRLGLKVVKFWGRVLDGEVPATTSEVIQVARDVAAYAYGKPKQQVQVDAKVTTNIEAHISVLKSLAGLDLNGPMIDANPLETQDNPSLDEKHSVSHGTEQPLALSNPDATLTVQPAKADPAAAEQSDEAREPPGPGDHRQGCGHDQVLAGGSQENVDPPPPAKRKRGRPRKNP